jgi:MFS family permease
MTILFGVNSIRFARLLLGAWLEHHAARRRRYCASHDPRFPKDIGLTPSEIVSPHRAPRRAIGGEFQTGWTVVAACFAAAVFAWGFAAFGPAVYLAELQRQYGWSAAAIGTATTIAFIVGAGLLPWVGAAINRFGSRAILTGGVVLIGAGVVGVSQVTAPWQLYAWNLLIGCGWAGASSTAISTILAQYFDNRRGLALSLALAGASAGGFAVAPGLIALSHHQGFGTAVPELTLVLILLILPLIWIGIRRPGVVFHSGSAAQGSDRALPRLSSRSTALRDARFWSVAGPFALAISAQVGMMVYQVSYLLPLIGVAGTSIALVCTSISAAGGRLMLSVFIDGLDQRPVSAVTFASQAAALTLMIAMPGSPAALYIGSIVFGLCMGNVVALPSLIIQREYAPSSFGLVLGLSTAIGQVGYSLSPALLGLVHDLTGGYRAVLGVCVGLQLAAALLITLGSLKKRLASRQQKRLASSWRV